MINILGAILLKIVKAYGWKIADDVLDAIKEACEDGKEPESESDSNRETTR